MKTILKRSQLFGLLTMTYCTQLFLYSLTTPFPISWVLKQLAKLVNFINTLQMLFHMSLMKFDRYLTNNKINHRYNDYR